MSTFAGSFISVAQGAPRQVPGAALPWSPLRATEIKPRANVLVSPGWKGAIIPIGTPPLGPPAHLDLAGRAGAWYGRPSFRRGFGRNRSHLSRKGVPMRRVLTVLALGLSGQNGRRTATGYSTEEDEALRQGKRERYRHARRLSHHDDWVNLEREGPEAYLLHFVPALNLGPEKNIDCSCLDEVVHSKNRLGLGEPVYDQQHSRGCYVARQRFADTYPFLDVLYQLCFLDALSPLEVGPNMGRSSRPARLYGQLRFIFRLLPLTPRGSVNPPTPARPAAKPSHDARRFRRPDRFHHRSLRRSASSGRLHGDHRHLAADADRSSPISSTDSSVAAHREPAYRRIARQRLRLRLAHHERRRSPRPAPAPAQLHRRVDAHEAARAMRLRGSP